MVVVMLVKLIDNKLNTHSLRTGSLQPENSSNNNDRPISVNHAVACHERDTA